MKKTWKKPMLEVLDVSLTMNGPGNAVPDCFDVGENNGNMNGNQDPTTSNNSCKNNLGS
ncbi:paeninodin family lasso peptide [Alkalihalobacillus sp. BA299]|uniref:paeninodin family lasso peptide n=1 Tax=Alkalihalobacillus sp. BA299 TaxID=2815938 RepID=UPI001AD971A9